MLRDQLEAVAGAVSTLRNLVVPATRRTIHNLAEQSLVHFGDALAEVVNVAEQRDVTVEAAQEASARYASKLEGLQELKLEIQRIRVLEHSVE